MSSEIPPKQEIDYGTGEGVAYGGDDPDSPVYIPIPANGDHGQDHQNKGRSGNDSRNIFKNTWSGIVKWAPRVINASAWNAIASIVIAVATIFYTVYAHRQWKAMSGQIEVMRDANGLIYKSIASNDEALEQTLAKMQVQADRTKDLADRMKDQAERTLTIANESKIQAGAAIVSSKAAKSAAGTAIDTLHIAQRAYIFTGSPSINFAAGTMHIPLTNGGHIPSGPIQIKAFQVTADIENPSSIRDGTVIDKRWIPLSKQALQIGQGIGFDVPIRMAVANKISTGSQIVVIAGTITYNDGFSDTLPQHWDFCFQTFYNPKTKIDAINICEPSTEIPKLMKIIEYPKNEDYPDP